MSYGTAIAALAIILGPNVCIHCMEPLSSPLHRELCVAVPPAPAIPTGRTTS